MKSNRFFTLNFGVIFTSCIVLSIFTLLFSYHATLLFFPQTVNQENTLDYLNNNQPLLQNYTAAELSHLEDVQKVMSLADNIFYVSLVLSLLLIIYGLKRKLLPKMLLYGGISIVSVIGLILILTLISFNSSFTAFHEIFFPQGNWQFPSDSLLIQTFQLDFFIKIDLTIFIQALMWGICLAFGGRLLRPALKITSYKN